MGNLCCKCCPGGDHSPRYTQIQRVSSQPAPLPVVGNFSDPLYINWLKATRGLSLTVGVLCRLCDTEMKTLHTQIIQRVMAQCNGNAQCSGSCVAGDYKKVSGHWIFSKCPAPGVCSVWLTEIKHECTATSINLTVGNADVLQWSLHHWQVAKVFMERGQDVASVNASDTDASGILQLIRNCKHFGSVIDLTKADAVRKQRNFLMHHESMKLSDPELRTVLVTLTDLLNDLYYRNRDATIPPVVTDIQQMERVTLDFNDKKVLEAERNAWHQVLADHATHLHQLYSDSEQQTQDINQNQTEISRLHKAVKANRDLTKRLGKGKDTKELLENVQEIVESEDTKRKVFEAELRRSEEARKSEEVRRKAAEDDLTTLRDELRQSKDETAKIKEEKNTLSDDLKRMTDDAEQAKEKLQRSEAARKTAEDDLTTLRDELRQSKDEAVKIKEEKNTLSDDLKRMTDDAEQAKEKLQRSEAARKTAEEENARLKMTKRRTGVTRPTVPTSPAERQFNRHDLEKTTPILNAVALARERKELWSTVSSPFLRNGRLDLDKAITSVQQLQDLKSLFASGSATNFTALTMDYCGLAGEEFTAMLGELSHLRQLKTLRLYNNDLHGRSMTTLKGSLVSLKNLDELDLSYSQIDDADIMTLTPALSSLTSLTFLGLGGNSIGDAGALHMTKEALKMASLQSIWFVNNLLTETGIQSVRDAASSTPRVWVACLDWQRPASETALCPDDVIFWQQRVNNLQTALSTLQTSPEPTNNTQRDMGVIQRKLASSKESLRKVQSQDNSSE